jgi:hypothetical protein
MTDQEEASALLASIAGTERRTREFLVYARAGDYMILWGVLLGIGYALSERVVPYTQDLWLAIQAAGFVGTGVITWRAARCRETGRSPLVVVRPLLAVCVVIGFGSLWTSLAHFGWREQSAFWPSFCAAILFVFGLWAGRAFCVGGALVFALTLGGFFWAGPWFDLWLAALCSSALILGGLWLRR